MWTEQRERYIASLRQRLSNARFAHTLGVEQVAVDLAVRNGVDMHRTATAALLHDYAKELPKAELLALAERFGIAVDPVYQASPGLLHGPVAARLVQQDFGISDAEVLAAICNHTVGRAGMTMMEKIVYLADMIEPLRDFPGVEALRALARQDLDAGMLGVPVVAAGIPTLMEAEEGADLVVTPRALDSVIAHGSALLAAAINRALQPRLSVAQLCWLTG